MREVRSLIDLKKNFGSCYLALVKSVDQFEIIRMAEINSYLNSALSCRRPRKPVGTQFGVVGAQENL